MRVLYLFLSTAAGTAFLASCAPAQHSVVAQSAQQLTVSGHLTMRERIGLSPLAVAEVALVEAGNPSAPALGQQRIPFNGRQVPIAFTLAVDKSLLRPGGHYILRGAIEDGDGSQRWAVEAPVTADPGTPRIDVGTLVVVREQLSAGTTPPPSGATGYRARGNEPGWLLEFGASELNFTWNTGQDRMTAPLPTAQQTGTGRQYQARGQGKTLVIDVTSTVCRDSMSGMSYPETVTATIDGKRLNGCGGNPASLLHGAEWTVESIAGVAVIPNTKVTMTFGTDGNLSGSGGCNRFNAGYTLTGEGLSIGTGMRTQMACEPPIMQQEDRFMAAIDSVQGFETAGPGRLTLLTASGERIIARR